MSMYSKYPTRFIPFLLLSLFMILSGGIGLSQVFAQEAEEVDPPEITNGERLFLETRFAQFFKVFLDGGKDVNDPLPAGDPAVDKVMNWNLPPDQFADSPFVGQSMNCRSCHFVDELGVEEPLPGYGMRTYTDFARRSPVPAREDRHTTTVRNSPPLVNASLPRKHFFLHFDAEFHTMVDLVKGTLTGRNYGWLPGEFAQAVAHIAKVIREDDGQGDLAMEFGGFSYTTLLTGTDPSIPGEFLLPESFRINISQASDRDIFTAVAKLIAAYTEDLAFSQDENGTFNSSPYDVFLTINDLPRQPQKGESPLAYSQRLLRHIHALESYGQLTFLHRSPPQHSRPHQNSKLKFVDQNPQIEDGKFQFHDQPFSFGPEELKGLKIFFSQNPHRLRPSDLVRGRSGNCVACHAPPTFTDFRFHNTGIAQAEYDHIHGPGSFANLTIPGLGERNRDPEMYLPATVQHPRAQEPFRSIPTSENSGLTDLGVWNIFWNPDFPSAQLPIWQILCEDSLKGRRGYWNIFHFCRPDRLLPHALGRFKTPGLRDLGHSAPYSHTGMADTLEDVIRGYMKNSDLARHHVLRNGDKELKQIALHQRDITPLVAFLQSLNEDYE